MLMLLMLVGCNEEEHTLVVDETQYILNIDVDPDDKTMDIEGTIHYKNEQLSLEEMYLMFYPNAISQYTEEDNVIISKLTINEIDYIDSEFVNEDSTALFIELEEEFLYGDILTIEFEYSFSLWDQGRLSITEDNSTLYSMFFYPFVPMFDDTGWHTEPYTFHGETYYNDIGDYDVVITLPEDYVLASGGREVSRINARGYTTYRYLLDDARDYSFSASTLYKVYEKQMLNTDMKIFSLGSLSPTELMDSWSYLEESFSTYERLIGDYYYDDFVLEYGNIYGMESTGIIYCSRDIEETTVVHEVVHMWFFSMIGNDQYNYSFLDESVTTYATSLYFLDRYGEYVMDDYLYSRSSLNTRFTDRFIDVIGDSLLRDVSSFGSQYGYEIYYHGPTLIDSYINIYLDDNHLEFARILSVYYDEYHKQIATLDDFLDLVERESGEHLTKEYFMMHLEFLQNPVNLPE